MVDSGYHRRLLSRHLRTLQLLQDDMQCICCHGCWQHRVVACCGPVLLRRQRQMDKADLAVPSIGGNQVARPIEDSIAQERSGMV